MTGDFTPQEEFEQDARAAEQYVHDEKEYAGEDPAHIARREKEFSATEDLFFAMRKCKDEGYGIPLETLAMTTVEALIKDQHEAEAFVVALVRAIDNKFHSK